jgi:hypothetical protein
MMTYLPLANVTLSVQSLHDSDLSLQIIEAGRALRQCSVKKYSSFDIVAMWRGYEGGLYHYFLQCCREAQRRDLLDVMRFLRAGHALVVGAGWHARPPLMPRWYGSRRIHQSHASTLIRLRPDHYAHHWPDVPLDMPVLWPRNHDRMFDYSIRLSHDDRRKILRGELTLAGEHDH